MMHYFNPYCFEKVTGIGIDIDIDIEDLFSVEYTYYTEQKKKRHMHI